MTETDPNSKVTTYGYNPAGRLATIRQSVAGASCIGTKVGCVTYGYDDAGRPTSVDYSDATPDVIAQPRLDKEACGSPESAMYCVPDRLPGKEPS